HHRAYAFGRALVGEEAPHGVLEQPLLFVEIEIHSAHRGSPRPRSAMMLRWMFAVPPPISMPNAHMNACTNMPIAGAMGSPLASAPRSARTSIAASVMSYIIRLVLSFVIIADTPA